MKKGTIMNKKTKKHNQKSQNLNNHNSIFSKLSRYLFLALWNYPKLIFIFSFFITLFLFFSLIITNLFNINSYYSILIMLVITIYLAFMLYRQAK